MIFIIFPLGNTRKNVFACCSEVFDDGCGTVLARFSSSAQVTVFKVYFNSAIVSFDPSQQFLIRSLLFRCYITFKSTSLLFIFNKAEEKCRTSKESAAKKTVPSGEESCGAL